MHFSTFFLFFPLFFCALFEMPGSKDQNVVLACKIRHLNLGPAKHEEVAIYAVNMRIPTGYRIARVTCNGAIRRHLNARVKNLKSHYDPDGIRTIFCSPSISVITSTGIWRLRSAWISGYTAKRSPCT